MKLWPCRKHERNEKRRQLDERDNLKDLRMIFKWLLKTNV
jgi:hypothetical protein